VISSRPRDSPSLLDKNDQFVLGTICFILGTNKTLTSLTRDDEYLSGSYKEFTEKSKSANIGEEYLKAEFAKQALTAFYAAMDYVFREGFGTNSQTVKDVVNGITGLLFGK
jgi:hypothetical protein